MTVCPHCGSVSTAIWCRSDVSETYGYRCERCGCEYIVTHPPKVKSYYREDDEHARDIWPADGGD